jgi:hypothetical protein
MNPWRAILLRARPSLIILVCAILVALALTIGSGYVESQRRAEFQLHHIQTNSLRNNLGARQKDLAYLEGHIALFRTLQKQGLTSPPAREGWVEHLLAARRDLHLPDTLVYALPPPAPLVSDSAEGGAAAPVDAGPDTPLTHDLNISVRDVHEDELLALLSRFQASINERFRVQSCSLSSPTPTGLTAECTLRFFTLPPAPSAASGTTP